MAGRLFDYWQELHVSFNERAVDNHFKWNRSKRTHATHSWNIFTDNLFLIEIISHHSCYFSCWRSFVFLLQQPQSSSSSNNNNSAGEADQCRERLKKREKHDGRPFSSCQKRFYYEELWEIEFFSLSDLSGCAASDPGPSITTVKTRAQLYTTWTR